VATATGEQAAGSRVMRDSPAASPRNEKKAIISQGPVKIPGLSGCFFIVQINPGSGHDHASGFRLRWHHASRPGFSQPDFPERIPPICLSPELGSARHRR
jgi:hypothetical protein